MNSPNTKHILIGFGVFFLVTALVLFYMMYVYIDTELFILMVSSGLIGFSSGLVTTFIAHRKEKKRKEKEKEDLLK